MPIVAKSLGASAVLAFLASACAAPREPILLGLVGPITQVRGRSMRLAAELAVRELNASGGVGGRRIELVMRDDSARPDVAVRVARTLYDNPRVVAVIGHLTSAATLAAAPIYNGGSHPIPAISPSASAPSISDAGPYIFRVCPTDDRHGTRLATFARQRLDVARAAVLYQDDEYGRGLRRAFVDEFVRRGGTVVTDDPYVPDLVSFEPYLRRLRARGGADALLIAGTAASAERILPTLDSVGLEMIVLGADALAGLERWPGAQGTYISAAYLPDQANPRNRAFVETYHGAFPGEPLDHRGAATYDIVHLLARALAASGTRRDRLRNYLAGVGTASRAFEGVTGRIAFDSQGDVPEKDVVVGVATGGRLAAVSGR